eukprot:Hpha_TRINITY_DN15287_c1_g6::TRINITY_DN15287_c1_g6_i1::g.67965::m.67965
MAYLSRPTAAQVWRRTFRGKPTGEENSEGESEHEEEEDAEPEPDDPTILSEGICKAGCFKGKLRCLAFIKSPFYGMPDRFWAGDQHGDISILNTEGDEVDKIETSERHGKVSAITTAVVPACNSHDHDDQIHVYVGYTTGFIRVYRLLADRSIFVSSGAGVKIDPESGVVRSVPPNSRAATAGLKPGHEILSVDGMPFTGHTLPAGPCHLHLRVVRCETTLEPEYQLVEEVKKHSGAITGLRAFLDHGVPCVVSCSADWQALLWQWTMKREHPEVPGKLLTEAEFKRFHCEEDWDLAREGSAALTVTSNFRQAKKGLQCSWYQEGKGGRKGRIYLGGDDFLVHCWDLQSALEESQGAKRGKEPPGYPARGHVGAVMGIVTCGVDLVTCSRDGSLRVWDAQRGVQTRALLPTCPDRPLLCLSVEPSRDDNPGRVWCGSAGGTVSVWDLTRLDPEVSLLEDNTGSITSGLVAVPSAAGASQVWTYNEATGKIILQVAAKMSVLDNGGAAGAIVPRTRDNGETGFTKVEAGMAEVIGALRIACVRSAHKCRVELAAKVRAEQFARKFTVAAAELNSRLHFLQCRRQRFRTLIRFHALRKQRRVLRIAADTLLTITNKGRTVRGMARFYKFVKWKKQLRRYRTIGKLLLSNTDNGIRGSYWLALSEYAKMGRRMKLRRDAAQAFLKGTGRGVRQVYLSKWRCWLCARRHTRDKRSAGALLLAHTKRGVMHLYFTKMRRWSSSKRLHSGYRQAVKRMLRKTVRGQMLMIWGRLRSFVPLRRRQKVNQLSAAVMGRSTDGCLRRVYLRKAYAYTMNLRKMTMEEKVKHMIKRVKTADKQVRQNEADICDLDASREAMKREIANLRKDVERTKVQKEDAKKRVYAASRMLENMYKPNPELTPVEQADELMLAAKAYACNCRTDVDTIRDAKTQNDAFKKGLGGVPPVELLAQGVREVEEAIQDSGFRTESGKPWQVHMYEFDSLLNGAEFRERCHRGIVKMVIGWDSLGRVVRRASIREKRRPEPTGEEECARQRWLRQGNGQVLLLNVPYFMYIVRRALQTREEQDQAMHEEAEVRAAAEAEEAAGLEGIRQRSPSFSRASMERRGSITRQDSLQGSVRRSGSVSSLPPRSSPLRRGSSVSIQNAPLPPPVPSRFSRVRFNSWCVAGHPLGPNPFEYEVGPSAIPDAHQRAVYACLSAASADAMDPDTQLGGMCLRDLLVDNLDPLRVLSHGGLESGRLEVQNMEGLKQYFLARGVAKTWVDSEVDSYMVDPRRRWSRWMPLTISQFVIDENSGEFSLSNCAPELTVSAAEYAHKGTRDAAARALRNAWRGDKVPNLAPLDGDDDLGFDFFRLHVWDLIQHRIVANAKTRKGAPSGQDWARALKALPNTLRDISGDGSKRAEGVLNTVRDLLTGPDGGVVVLTGVPKPWLSSGGALRSDVLRTSNIRVAHLRQTISSEGNTAIMFTQEFDLDAVSSMRTPHGHPSPGCIWARLKERSTGNPFTIVGLGQPAAQGEAAHYAGELEKVLRQSGGHCFVGGALASDLLRLADSPTRLNLSRLVSSSRCSGVTGRASGSIGGRSFFQSELNAIGEENTQTETILCGDGMAEVTQVPINTEATQRTLPDAGVPSAYLPTSVVTVLRPPQCDPLEFRSILAAKRSSTLSRTTSMSASRRCSLSAYEMMPCLRSQSPAPVPPMHPQTPALQQRRGSVNSMSPGHKPSAPLPPQPDSSARRRSVTSLQPTPRPGSSRSGTPQRHGSSSVLRPTTGSSATLKGKTGSVRRSPTRRASVSSVSSFRSGAISARERPSRLI